jgi:hypothetical protein
VTVKYRESQFARQINTETTAKVEKCKQIAAGSLWTTLRVENSRVHDNSVLRALHLCEFYFQDGDQVLTVGKSAKSPDAFWQGKNKQTHLETYHSMWYICLPSGETNQANPNLLGFDQRDREITDSRPLLPSSPNWGARGGKDSEALVKVTDQRHRLTKSFRPNHRPGTFLPCTLLPPLNGLFTVLLFPSMPYPDM